MLLFSLPRKIKSTLCDVNSHRRNVHGVCELPENYRLRPLSESSRITREDGKRPGNVELCTSYSFSKAIAAIIQAVLASITLYRSRGDQIELYGYAAFGLTTLPYIVMSITNLFAALVMPEYPSVFVVLSETSDEAVAMGGRIEGAVGRLVEPDSNTTSRQSDSSRNPSSQGAPNEGASNAGANQSPTVPIRAGTGHVSMRNGVNQVSDTSQGASTDFIEVTWSRGRRMTTGLVVGFAAFFLGGICIGILRWLSHFQPGHSTLAQRVWIMTWLAFGLVMGTYVEIVYVLVREIIDFWDEQQTWQRASSQILCCGLLAAPAIGGFVVVGQMLKSYGSCTFLK